MFKKIFFLLMLASLGCLKAQENAVDLLSIPGPIDYDGTEFLLSWSKQPSKTLFRQQYMLRDERIEDFTQILDFSYFTKEIEMELAVRQKVESIQNREKNDKFAKVNVAESPDGKEYVIDYFISENPEKGEPYIEYDIYRFKPYDNGTQKSFLIISYAKRVYGDLKSAAKSLAKERDHALATMIEYKIPEIKVVAVSAGK
ncbi:hypothetical protein L0B70_01545 [Kaistella sp. 97-N-M2]|uniref:hypothetical protein n=1 Tax=Kaistella sp. 97-N-M2 TaxID=2908645 RepID=UPI001F345C8D|nr:hypothetical protein [Kaistella sp. 97-N-M2]UJF30105.1 hypothetical protein L0B70_01545 [Kaistella sp. 97-N-M2]